MARIPLTHRPSLTLTAVTALSKRAFGRVPDIVLVALHHRGYAVATVAHEALASRWRTLSPTHQALAVLSCAMEIGCSWCVDFGYWQFHHQGVEPGTLRDIADAETSPSYTRLDRAVIGYAAAMSRTPPEVSDDMVAELREHFSDEQLVELTALVALENQRSRMNAALGLTSQGFSDSCTLDREPALSVDERHPCRALRGLPRVHARCRVSNHGESHRRRGCGPRRVAALGWRRPRRGADRQGVPDHDDHSDCAKPCSRPAATPRRLRRALVARALDGSRDGPAY